MLLQKVVLLRDPVLGGLACRLAGVAGPRRPAGRGQRLRVEPVRRRAALDRALAAAAVLGGAPWLVREGVRLRTPDRRRCRSSSCSLAERERQPDVRCHALLAVGATRRTAPRLVVLVAAANARGRRGTAPPARPRPRPPGASSVSAVRDHCWSGGRADPGRHLERRGGCPPRGRLALPLALTVVPSPWPPWARPVARSSAPDDRCARRPLAVVRRGVGAVLGGAGRGRMAGEHGAGGGLLRTGAGRWRCARLLMALVAAGVERCRPAGALTVGLRSWSDGWALVPLVLHGRCHGDLRDLGPADYLRVADAREALGAGHGDLLVLPFTSYRAPGEPRSQGARPGCRATCVPNYVVDDRLFRGRPGGAGRDPRVPDVLAASPARRPPGRTPSPTSGSARSGPHRADHRGHDAEVAGTGVFTSAALEVVEIDAPLDQREVPAPGGGARRPGRPSGGLVLPGCWNVIHVMLTRRPPQLGPGDTFAARGGTSTQAIFWILASMLVRRQPGTSRSSDWRTRRPPRRTSRRPA